MQIQLQELELTKAIKQYLTTKGLDLSQKKVTVAFTAKRKGGGLTADVAIEDTGIPGFGDGTPHPDDEPAVIEPTQAAGLRLVSETSETSEVQATNVASAVEDQQPGAEVSEACPPATEDSVEDPQQGVEVAPQAPVLGAGKSLFHRTQ